MNLLRTRHYRLALAYQHALDEYGRMEIPGTANNPEVQKYMSHTWFDDHRDSVPWCSAFMNWCMVMAGLPKTNNPRAKSWLDWGMQTYRPVTGDLVVMHRKGGGHVGFYVASGRDRVAVLGGNQEDSVCIKDYDQTRVIQYRTFVQSSIEEIQA